MSVVPSSVILASVIVKIPVGSSVTSILWLFKSAIKSPRVVVDVNVT